ncbi:MAG TPA: SRPBCC family protein [Acidimicrobiales bacterium]|nr:SRPBCC family protein [Acidimicrobiales bacterium]
MTDVPAPDPADSVSLRIEATPEALYDLVSEPSNMGRLSPECTGGHWLDGATGPAVGARFKGTNKRGFVRWSTKSRVIAAERGKEFAFEVGDSGTRWRYAFEPDGTGTVVTESRAASKPYPFIAKAFTTVLLGGVDGHTEELRAGMAATLQRLKELAEAPA